MGPIMGFCQEITINEPELYVSYISIPIVTNWGIYISGLDYACQRTKRTISLAYSNLYQIVIMQHVFCGGIFILMIYARQLTWQWPFQTILTIFGVPMISSFLIFSRSCYSIVAFFVIMYYPFSLLVMMLTTALLQ